MLAGCSLISGVGRIKSGDVTVQGVKDAGKGANLSTSQAGTTIALPQGSHIVKREIKGLGYRPATKTTPEQKETPAETITEIYPNGETVYVQTESNVKADTGTIDTSVREHQIDAQESRPLLYASIGAALATGAFVYLSYPTPAICCGAASIVFFMAWKVSDLPSWFYAIGVAALVGGGALWLGHNRGLYEPVPTDKPSP